MPVEFLSHDQVSRYGRFASAPTPGELEQFFRLDAKALESARSKRAPANRLGWAVQWGCVRMLGVFPTEDLSVVPEVVVRFAAEQLGVDPGEFAAYGARRQNRYEHAWEIRDAYAYRESPAAEAQVREFLATRVWASWEGPRALFDRAVGWLVDNRVLLPGITTLTRLVAEVRAQENAALYRTLDEAVPEKLRQSMRDLLKVPEGRRVSELERLRRSPMGVSGSADRLAFSERIRMEAVAMFTAGPGSTDIAKELRVSVQSVQRWRSGLAGDRPGRGAVPQPVSVELSETLFAALDEERAKGFAPSWTIRYLHHDFPIFGQRYAYKWSQGCLHSFGRSAQGYRDQ